MAVVNDVIYENSSTSIKKAVKVGGSDAIFVATTFEVDSGDSSGSTYRIAKVPSNYVPVKIEINNDAISGLTDVDLGLYLTSEFGGTAKDADLLVDGADLSSAHVIGSELEGMSALDVSKIGDNLASLVSDVVSEYQAYDLVLTINADAGASGTVSVRAIFVNGA